ncbi:hypothetical protein LZ32DRAFT_623080 [Colletotrichum eremochloae]|nr:hypothetical protein LZ32DRAFT_623080 [Colletotrichum eremochloae]
MAAITSSPPKTPPHDADNELAAHSIRSIMRLHPRERLFVRPLHWTPRHVDLLSCSFTHTPRSDDESRLSPPSSPPNHNLNPSSSSSSSSETTKSTNDGQPQQSSVDKYMEILARGRFPSSKAGALGDLMSNGPTTLKQLNREASLEYICNPPRSYPSNPTLRIYDKMLAQITPSNPLEDPYILAVLIAIAQSQQRRYAQARLLPATQSFQVYVVVTDAKEKSHLVVYTADVPVVFLDRLATPHERPRDACHLVVRSVDIPFEPYSSFPERLTHVVTPPSKKRSQDTDPCNADTRDSKRRKMA